MTNSTTITTAEQLLTFCDLRKPDKVHYIDLSVHLQIAEPRIFIGHSAYKYAFIQKDFFLTDDLYQLFFTLQRFPTSTKNKGMWDAVRPESYRLDESEFLACLKGEVRIRRLKALLA